MNDPNLSQKGWEKSFSLGCPPKFLDSQQISRLPDMLYHQYLAEPGGEAPAFRQVACTTHFAAVRAAITELFYFFHYILRFVSFLRCFISQVHLYMNTGESPGFSRGRGFKCYEMHSLLANRARTDSGSSG